MLISHGGSNISDRDAWQKCDGTSAHPHEQHEQTWPRYWVMEGTDAQNPLSKMNPFLVSKGIQGISQSIKVRRLCNGSLLLTCDALSQARSLKKITRLGTAPVKVTPQDHEFLSRNSSMLWNFWHEWGWHQAGACQSGSHQSEAIHCQERWPS